LDPVTLIVTALAAGASTGVAGALKDDAAEGAKAAYAKLRGLVRRRVAGHPHGELALQHYEAAPQKWEGLLAAELTEAGADGDADLVAAAEALMALLDQAGARAGKYQVTLTGASGVQVGDGNVQVNRF